MEQDADSGVKEVCSACLSSDRDLFEINNATHVYQIFQLIMSDFAGDRPGEQDSDMRQLTCWECLAMLKRFLKFKGQVHSAQEHLRVLNETQEGKDHTYISQSMSSLRVETKCDYDNIFVDFSIGDDGQEPYETVPTTSNNVKKEEFNVIKIEREVGMGSDDNVSQGTGLVLQNPVTGVKSHIVIDSDKVKYDGYRQSSKGVMPQITISPMTQPKSASMIVHNVKEEHTASPSSTYVTEYMTHDEMLARREKAKEDAQYANSGYKCELCVIGFYTPQQVEDHFISMHKPKPGCLSCKICYVFVDKMTMKVHNHEHYYRYVCKLCDNTEYYLDKAQAHERTHVIGQSADDIGNGDKMKKKDGVNKVTVKRNRTRPGHVRKWIPKMTIEGYKCIECDMFFKSSRERRSHVERCHRERLQCDLCKKTFVNKFSLKLHLRLHEGPLPRSECQICHKMICDGQMKSHVRRHQNTTHYKCTVCDKVFSQLLYYQAHLKKARAHASEQNYKFSCPMCNRGYTTKEAMQDHFNSQHLGITAHKCPICEKPLTTRLNVKYHMMRVHGEKKEQQRKHVCQMCGRAFFSKQSLTQHELIHTGEKPLSCDLCEKTFKQRSSLYSHKKRVHKVLPPKKVLQYIETPTES